ncbi:MAG: hypothetical protein JJU06_08060 [Ectothiorhodospiraceae bacterium]|nr:hypothetical protein [Ectothiorhodospiraceae bacterium]MCH8505247.1 hypothetical protein [Ectothiorhodospiraceae bacterium]
MANIIDFSLRRPIDGSTKERARASGETANGRTVQWLEEKRRQYGPNWAGWKLRKRSPEERASLIQLARNLGAILAELPHGTRAHALEAAKGPDSAAKGDANKYVTRVAISPSRSEAAAELARRLTPYVSKYISVARAAGELVTSSRVETDPNHFMARLFRDTRLGGESRRREESAEWAAELAAMLNAVCDAVARRNQLGPLFDRMDEANIFASDNSRSPDFLPTSWLSETFHKLSIWHLAPSEQDTYRILSRTEDGTPWCGDALFVPRVQLMTEVRAVDVRMRLSSPFGCKGWSAPPEPAVSSVRLVFRLETWLAIMPDAVDHATPALTRACLLIRPAVTAEPKAGRDQVLWLGSKPGLLRALLMYGDDDEGGEIWESSDSTTDWLASLPEQFLEWFHEEELQVGALGEVSAEQSYDSFGFRTDLRDGPWWVLPVNDVVVKQTLGDALYTEPYSLDFRYPDTFSSCPALAEVDELIELPLNSMMPTLAPPSTAACALQLHFLDEGAGSHLIAELEKDALRIRATFERLENSVRSSLNAAQQRFLEGLERHGDGEA